MRQVEIVAGGELRVVEAPIPVPGPSEVLIKVEAAGVNRADLLQRAGRYALRPGVSPILGLEVAGTIEALGPISRNAAPPRWAFGDRVCALLTGGGYAEYAVAPAPQCLPIPDGLDMIQAGSLPEAFFTVWLDVFDLGGLKPGEALLVHGGSSGIGITAIQLAKAFGSHVVVTAGSEEKCEACRKLGADAAINYRVADFEKETGPVDVILDMVGGSYTIKNLRLLAPGGRLVYINFMESNKAEIDLSLILGRQLTITGSGLRPQTIERKAAIARNLEERVWPLISNREISSGQIRPVVDSVYPLERASEAHLRMESSRHIGKIMLRVDS